jgi:thioredoxin domain-containing protein 5
MAPRVAIALLCLAAALTVACASTDFHDDNVVNLTDDTFETAVADGKIYLVKLYAPWCGHCKRLAPTWKELGEAYAEDDQVAIAHVDCTVSRNVCTKMEIAGYPTVKLIHKGQPTAYSGARDFKTFKKFVDEHKAKLLMV